MSDDRTIANKFRAKCLQSDPASVLFCEDDELSLSSDATVNEHPKDLAIENKKKEIDEEYGMNQLRTMLRQAEAMRSESVSGRSADFWDREILAFGHAIEVLTQKNRAAAKLHVETKMANGSEIGLSSTAETVIDYVEPGPPSLIRRDI